MARRHIRNRWELCQDRGGGDPASCVEQRVSPAQNARPCAVARAESPCAATRQHIFRHRCEYPDKPASASHEDAEAYTGRFHLKVGALNALLDELVVAGGSGYGRAAKASAQGGGGAAAATKADVLSRMMRQTTPKQMRWVVQIILGNLKARCESTSLFNMSV